MKKILLFCFVCSIGFAKSICLNMIVKDEAQVIERCLRSVKPYIDHWIIVDTGSSDNTQEIIKNSLKGIPGKLFENEFHDFSTSRNEALLLAKDKADYLLFIDADETLQVLDPHFMDHINDEAYFVNVDITDATIQRIALLKNDSKAMWKGKIHEILTPLKSTPLQALRLDATRTDSARSRDPLKLQKDAELLESELAQNPSDNRLRAHLARTYYVLKAYEKGLQVAKEYQDSTDESAFYCQFLTAYLLEQTNASFAAVLKEYRVAIQMRPHRTEPYFFLSRYFAKKNNSFLAYIISKEALDLPTPNDAYFVEKWVCEWGIKLIYADNAKKTGYFEEAIKAYEQALLFENHLPQGSKEAIVQSIKGCEKICEKS